MMQLLHGDPWKKEKERIDRCKRKFLYMRLNCNAKSGAKEGNSLYF